MTSKKKKKLWVMICLLQTLISNKQLYIYKIGNNLFISIMKLSHWYINNNTKK